MANFSGQNIYQSSSQSSGVAATNSNQNFNGTPGVAIVKSAATVAAKGGGSSSDTVIATVGQIYPRLS